MRTTAEVRLWGTTIGAVTLADGDHVATFDYEPGFSAAGVEVAPLTMPVEAGRRYRFPGLAAESFKGLPGPLADSLPDRFGTTLIDAWLAERGESLADFDAIRRLCYTGRRGMGALEFIPAEGPKADTDHVLDIAALNDLAAQALGNQSEFRTSLKDPGKREAVRDMLRVGTSPGGARAKALVALNPETGEIRSGQLNAPSGFEHWILKFDGVDDETRDLGNARGYGLIELAYYRMAVEAGIEMSECRLLEEEGRRHFMTRRFDRDARGSKLHMQSLAAIAHLDFNQVGANSYEQAFRVIHELDLPQSDTEQQFRRMVFNIVARNQDDHVKNIAFLMNRRGEWSLSPAFDIVFAYNPERGRFTQQHQMSANGKRDDFTVEDLNRAGTIAGLPRGRAEEILIDVTAAVRTWPEKAGDLGLDDSRITTIRENHRLELPRR